MKTFPASHIITEVQFPLLFCEVTRYTETGPVFYLFSVLTHKTGSVSFALSLRKVSRIRSVSYKSTGNGREHNFPSFL